MWYVNVNELKYLKDCSGLALNLNLSKSYKKKGSLAAKCEDPTMGPEFYC